jgi:ABC-type multidrug transport system fused ATPase/permease subunit
MHQMRDRNFNWFPPSNSSSRISMRISQAGVKRNPRASTAPSSRERESAGRSVGGSYLEAGLVLRGLSFEAVAGSLTAVCGPIAAGKTSFLAAILGEMYEAPAFLDESYATGGGDPGATKVRGHSVYVPQQAWCLNATVRENICFGLPYDAQRFNLVVEACCLTTDIAGFPDGLEQMIGARVYVRGGR